MTLNRVRQSFLAVGVFLFLSLPMSGQAIMTTSGRGNQILIFPTPSEGLPNPTVQVVSGLPSNAVPHGIACQGNGRCLVADGGNFRIFNIDLTRGALKDTNDTSGLGYDGWGTIAYGSASTGEVLLAASDHDSNLHVVFPLNNDQPQEFTVPLSGSVDRYQTDAIVFDANGRAFVHCVKKGSMAIDVFDPPYTAKSFTMTAPVQDLSGSLTISNNGQTLLATDGIDGSIVIFEAPFSASTVPVVRPAPSGTHAFSGITATPGSPESTGVVVVDSAKPYSEFFNGPYESSASTDVELPPSVTAFSTGFESVAVSGVLSDGSQVGIATGEVAASAAGQPAVFVVVPGGSDNASVFAVTIPGGGRGRGCARFVATTPAGPMSRCCVNPIAQPPNADVNPPGGRVTSSD